MDNTFFFNAGIPPPLHLAPPHSIPTWPSLSSSANSPECLYIPNWDNHHDQFDHQSLHFESALSSMVSSPVVSTPNVSNESFVVRQHIGRLSNSNMSTTNTPMTSCYSTPLNSPPKIKSSMPVSSSVVEFAADPGFAARAARLSCFGSRSFNGRNRGDNSEVGLGSNGVMGNGNSKLARVSSSPSLNALASEQRNLPISSREESNSAVVSPSTDLSSRKRKVASKDKDKDQIKVAEARNASDVNAKRCKANENRKNENGSVKAEEGAKGSTSSDEKQSKKTQEPVKDYIHVRARRGEATDSHSLAERVRREKIGERMKLLQDLVPGCNKVTGKAVMLDEIINYVQSLQGQVEFLSMKLSSVNTRLDFNMDALISKEMFQPQSSSFPHPVFTSDSSAQSTYGHQQNPPHCSVDPLESALFQSLGMQLPSLNALSEAMPQYPTFGEGDLHTIVQMGFDQNSNDQNGSNQAFHMKIEL